MKRNLIFTIIILAGAINACTDLEEYPYGFYSDKNFYQNPREADIAMMYAYSAFNYNEYRRGYFDLGDMPSETMDNKPGENQNGRNELEGWTVTSNTEGLNNYFKQSYIVINRSNAVIENLEGISFDETEKNQIIGEALFLRSWNHFNLVRLFGAVPIRTSMVAEVSQAQSELSSIQDVYAQIIGDLEDAEEKMTVRRRFGRVDKVAAQGLMAKVYLTLASSKETGVPRYDWVSSAGDMYSKAAEWAGKVVNDQSEYGLDTSITHIFDVNEADGPEHIFFLSNDRSRPTGNGAIENMFMVHNGYNPYYFKNPDGSLDLQYFGWEVYRVNPDFFATFPAGDKRVSYMYTDKIYDETGAEVTRSSDWIICRKYCDPEYVGYELNNSKPLFMRFSDIALIYAEAVGATSEGYKWVNAIRNRSGLADLTTGLSDADFREAVFLERGWELNFEGHRLYDLRRTRKVVDKVGNVDYAYFYPIPQEEIELNPNISADPEKKTLR